MTKEFKINADIFLEAENGISIDEAESLLEEVLQVMPVKVNSVEIIEDE